MANIRVNGKKFQVQEPSLGHYQIVALDRGQGRDPKLFEVFYQGRIKGGSLKVGESVPIEEGMTFHVTNTGHA